MDAWSRTIWTKMGWAQHSSLGGLWTAQRQTLLSTRPVGTHSMEKMHLPASVKQSCPWWLAKALGNACLLSGSPLKSAKSSELIPSRKENEGNEGVALGSGLWSLTCSYQPPVVDAYFALSLFPLLQSGSRTLARIFFLSRHKAKIKLKISVISQAWKIFYRNSSKIWNSC